MKRKLVFGTFMAAVLAVIVSAACVAPAFAVTTHEEPVNVMVVEWQESQQAVVYARPPTDNSMSNPNYRLLSYHWYTTANYWINTRNAYGFSASAVAAAITASANTWDSKTSKAVFSYKGTTTRSAGIRDNYNVVAWGTYLVGITAVTYIWYTGSRVVETDTRMNTYYRWSLSGEASKLDVKNIMTHEFGHWAGLNDLSSDSDYWLTMYHYSNFGETYKRTLGLGDIRGLLAITSGATSTLTVTSPNGGQIWKRGTTHTITWSKSGSTGSYVKIELLKSGVVNRVIASSTANDGSYSWTIPSTQTAGTTYKIRITSTTYSSISDSSNSNFAITT